MRRSTIIFSSIIVVLVVSNIWTFVWSLDCGITASYQQPELRAKEVALNQSLDIIRALTKSPPQKPIVVAAANRSATDTSAFEKDGFLWIDRIALKFGPDGRLVDIKANP